MICAVCHRMLRGHEGRTWRGTYDLHFHHHENVLELHKSADMGCCICRVIWDEVSRLKQAEKKANNKEPCFIRAGLSRIRGWDGVYRLDFKLRTTEIPVGTFVLKQAGEFLSPYLFSYHLLTLEINKTPYMLQFALRSLVTHRPTRFSN